ncbi:hypothetical protein [Nocardia nova]|uniref:hypothetical protein n=1 Tax=Nocardia nova TaxID=37330 RepID=UPI001FEC277A|nr:hypothetical protein [Nocardia nova]
MATTSAGDLGADHLRRMPAIHQLDATFTHPVGQSPPPPTALFGHRRHGVDARMPGLQRAQPDADLFERRLRTASRENRHWFGHRTPSTFGIAVGNER